MSRDSIPYAHLLTLEEYNQSWEVWDSAWGSTRIADEQAGRRYDLGRYQEAARLARTKYTQDTLSARLVSWSNFCDRIGV